MIESRISAAVYTQTTDVEIETNGLMTYDRRVLKLDTLAAAHREPYAPIRKLAFDARAKLDEVRVSAVSLPARLLLWSPD